MLLLLMGHDDKAIYFAFCVLQPVLFDLVCNFFILSLMVKKKNHKNNQKSRKKSKNHKKITKSQKN